MARRSATVLAASAAESDGASVGGTDVVRRLLALLASRPFQDGDRIPSERSLAAELAAPRSVVREAVRSLVLIGLLESQPGRGTNIRASDSEWVSKAIEWGLVLGVRNTTDIVEARSHIEVLSAVLAAERHDDADVQFLRRVVDEMQCAETDRDHLIRLDVDFHFGLARATKSEVLPRLLESVSALLEVWISRVVAWTPEARLHGTMYLEHGEILDAVAASDAALAGQLMEQAMRIGQRSLIEALQAAAQRSALPAANDLLVVRRRLTDGSESSLRPVGTARDD
jgi:GntR family transcriptional regulator, transcriptional repressor for pyruvate dehydrogenase complex